MKRWEVVLEGPAGAAVDYIWADYWVHIDHWILGETQDGHAVAHLPIARVISIKLDLSLRSEAGTAPAAPTPGSLVGQESAYAFANERVPDATPDVEQHVSGAVGSASTAHPSGDPIPANEQQAAHGGSPTALRAPASYSPF